MKILITGGSGLLGQYLNIALSERNTIFTIYNSNEGNCKLFPSVNLNLNDTGKLKEVFIAFRPEIVIHTAAISRPESCDELPKDYVMDVNVNSSIEIARLCHLHKSKLIYTSTDLVYDGEQGQMLKEDSKLNPISLYAETKLQSEDGIRNNTDDYVILRTSLLFGIGLNGSVNNFHNMYYSFKNNKPVKLFYDQYRTPLSLLDASRLIEMLISVHAENGVLNFGGNERVSRVELGEILCRLGKFDNSLIEKTSMYDVPKLHKVEDVSMNTEKLNSLGLIQNSIEESVMEILQTSIE